MGGECDASGVRWVEIRDDPKDYSSDDFRKQDIAC